MTPDEIAYLFVGLLAGVLFGSWLTAVFAGGE